MNDNLRNRADDKFEKKFGMTYEEFNKLSFDEQRKIVESNRKNRKKDEDTSSVMVGYGDNSVVTDVHKGDEVIVRYGNVVETGLTREETKERLEDDLDEALYNRTVAFVKKLTRKIKKKIV